MVIQLTQMHDITAHQHYQFFVHKQLVIIRIPQMYAEMHKSCHKDAINQ